MDKPWDQKYAGVISAFAVMSFSLLISLTILQLRVNIETASIIDHAVILTSYAPTHPRTRGKMPEPVGPDNTVLRATSM